jgi:phage baseplate assembly protein W
MSGSISNRIVYSDFDIGFRLNPIGNDLAKIINENAVKRSIKNIIFTNFYERPFRPSVGSNVNKLLFENISPITVEILQTAIADAIRNHEPRANLIEVLATPYEDQNGIYVSIVFSIINKEDPISLELSLDRIR